MSKFLFPELVNPKVSIAVATYNGAKFLKEQFDTLVGQDYPNLEIVVSDDSSTDDTIAILETYKAKFPAFSIHRNSGKKGIKGNFENAIAHCSGELIALSDQDDIWMLNKISRCVAELGRYALIYHDSLFVNDAGESLGKSISTRLNCYTGFDARAFLICNTVSGHALVVRREIIPLSLPFPAPRHHDWWLAFRAAENGGVKYLDEILVHYRQHATSQTDFYNLKKKTAAEKAAEREKLRQEELDWLEVCEAAPGRHQKFIHRWKELTADRKNHAFNRKYFVLAMSAIDSLFPMRKKSKASTFFFILRSSWGEDFRKKVKKFKQRMLFQRRTEDDVLLFNDNWDR